MSNYKIASRYAKAFAELIEKPNQADEYLGELNAVEQSLSGEESGNLFDNPKLSVEEKLGVMEKLVKEWSLSPYIGNLLKVLTKNQRLRILPELIEKIKHKADEMNNRVRVYLTVSDPKETSLKDKIEKELSAKFGKTVVVESVCEPSILGGMILKIEGQVYDASVKNYFTNIKNNLLNH